MQIKTFLTLALVGLVAAAPADLPTIKGSLTTIIDSLTTLDNSIKALVPGANAAAAYNELTGKADAVLAALKDGTSKVSTTSAISLNEALSVQPLSGQLNTIADQVVTDFIAKKNLIAGEKKTADVVKAMQAQKVATGDYVKALNAKLPAAVKSIADASAQKGIASLDRGIAAFSK